MPKITFSGSSGYSFAKKRKRMPGTDSTRKPEVKAWDCLNPSNAADTFTSHSILNMAYSSNTLPSNTHLSWDPIVLSNPNAGTGSTQLIGDRYLFKYLKIKGYVEASNRVLSPINWRLVLCRYIAEGSIIRSSYLTKFNNVATYPNPATVTTVNEFCVQNYYQKIADVKDNATFKRKVIATGTVPKTNTYTLEYSKADPGSVDRENASYSNTHNTADVGCRFPIDVTVTINDNMESNIRYVLLLEVDDGVGMKMLDTTFAFNSAGGGQDLAYQNAQFFVNFITKGYFYDY